MEDDHAFDRPARPDDPRGVPGHPGSIVGRSAGHDQPAMTRSKETPGCPDPGFTRLPARVGPVVARQTPGIQHPRIFQFRLIALMTFAEFYDQ
jgi:hypothetical protein